MIELTATLAGEQPTYETAYVGMRVKCVKGGIIDSSAVLNRTGKIIALYPDMDLRQCDCRVDFSSPSSHTYRNWAIMFSALEVIE